MSERRETANLLRLVGYLIEVTALGTWLMASYYFDPTDPESIVPEHVYSLIQGAVIPCAALGAVIIFTGSYLRMRPENAQETYERIRSEREEDARS